MASRNCTPSGSNTRHCWPLLSSPITTPGRHGYLAAAAQLTADLDATVTRLGTAWALLRDLLLEHARR